MEATSFNRCIIEANGGPSFVLNSTGLYGFSLTNSTVQWNNAILNGVPQYNSYTEFYLTRSSSNAGGSIHGTYFETGGSIGASTALFPTNNAGMLGKYVGNDNFFNGTYSPMTYSAAVRHYLRAVPAAALQIMQLLRSPMLPTARQGRPMSAAGRRNVT
jgi:hypothetical protein